jgi:hypothetical protein
MTLDDTEDPAPLAPSSVPPMPIEHFESRAISTLPAPPPDAETVATMVIAALGVRLDKLGKQLDSLTDLVNATRAQQSNAQAKIDAIDYTMGRVLHLVTEAGANVERIADAIGPRSEGQPPIFEALRQLETVVGSISIDAEALRTHVLGKGASIHDLQEAEERRHSTAAPAGRTDR